MPFITQGKTNWKFLLIVIILAIIVGGGALWYAGRPEKPYQSVKIQKTEVKSNQEQSCFDSGGVVLTSLCCKSSNYFPNSCIIGACGCSIDDSHMIKTCECGTGKCFDGEKCITTETKVEKETIEKICSYNPVHDYPIQEGSDFRAKNRSCAILIKEKNGYIVEVNGVKSRVYPDIELESYQASFSPDGKHFAFTVSRILENGISKKVEEFLVVDNIEGPVYHRVDDPEYSPDGLHFGYCAEEEGKYFKIIDGEKEEITKDDYLYKCDHLFPTATDLPRDTSPDGQYRVEIDRPCSLMQECEVKVSLIHIPTGEVKYNTSMGYSISHFIFSSDSKHLAFIYDLWPRQSVVIDGKSISDDYDEIFNLSFSNDNRFIKYNARLYHDIYYIVQALN